MPCSERQSVDATAEVRLLESLAGSGGEQHAERLGDMCACAGAALPGGRRPGRGLALRGDVWTVDGRCDPGVTVVEVFAWLCEAQIY